MILSREPNFDKAIARRDWLATCTSAGLTGLALTTRRPRSVQAAESGKALIAITLDLEMSRNCPRWEDTFWDYEKGNLNDDTKRYSVTAARRTKMAGGVVHFFAVGRVLEQENVDWMHELLAEGHSIGNHTYDHVNVTAQTVGDVQFRFRRSPWLVEGKTPAEMIRENIRLCSLAMARRLGVKPNGFRTPGGFSAGRTDHPHVATMLQELGFDWVSSLYPSHANTGPMEKPSAAVIDSIVTSQRQAQPFKYPNGLIEIPMSPISDIGAFRTGRWKLDWFLTAIREAVDWAIENRAVFDFLAHPSCLYVVDPEFKAIELICQLANDAGDRAALVDLGTISNRVRAEES